MESYQHIIEVIALTLGVGWASGLNLYATLFTLGYMQAAGYVSLPPDLQVLADPLVMMAAGFMYLVEFFTDKTPGVDTIWDTLHTFIRIPAGALLAAGAVGDVAPAAELAAAIVGGSLAAGSHALKAGGRVLINTSPEPVTNWTASFAEDFAVIGGLWTALNHPVVFLVFLGLFLGLLAWLIPKIGRGVKALWSRLSAFFTGNSAEPASPPLLARDRKEGSSSDRTQA